MEVRPIVQTFQAGVPTVIPVGGRYFRVTANVNPFTLEVGRDGQFIATIPGSIAGDNGECRDGEPNFDALRITTTGTESVSILITDGSIRRDSQNSDVSDRAGRLLGIGYGNLGQLAQELLNGVNALVTACKGTLGTLAQLALGGVNALITTDRGFSYGAAFTSITALGATTNEQVVAPGSNTNGLIVWDADLSTEGTIAQTALIAKSSAPASATDGDTLLLAMARQATAVGQDCFTVGLRRSVFVAAGKGLYFRNSAASAEGVGYRRVLYTIL